MKGTSTDVLHTWPPSPFFHALAVLVVDELKCSCLLLLGCRWDLVSEHEQLSFSNYILEGKSLNQSLNQNPAIN